MDQLKIESARGSSEGVCILRLSGPFTLQGVMDFQSVFRECNEPVTVIDLAGVPYMDSAALGALISVHTSAQRHDRKYAFTGVSERLRSLINLTGVGDILITCPTVEDAEKKLTSKAASN